MPELVVLVEEQSMKALLDGLLPRILPAGWFPRIIPHQGRSDLETSVTRKLRAWRAPDTRFIVMRDNDRGDCRHRKQALQDRINGTGRETQTKVRIVCQELEAWVIGDLAALEIVKGRASARLRRAAQDPDTVDYPVRLLEHHYGHYPKIQSASEIARNMNVNANTSRSFNALLAAVRELTEAV